MVVLFKIAFRNILRNFRRSFLTFFAIALGLVIFLLMDSMLTGIDEESFDRIINYETGHIKIFSKGYQEDKKNLPLDKSINRPLAMLEKLKKDKEVAAATSRINFRITLSNGIDQFPAIGIAVDPTYDKNVFKLQDTVELGNFLTSNAQEMLVGEGLAKDYKVGVGDYLTVLMRTKYETYQALDLKIKGILKSEDPNIDWYSVVIPLKLGQQSLDMGNSVTEIDIKLKDPKKINEFRDKLAAELSGVEVATWKDLSEDVVAIGGSKRKVSSFLLATVVIIALIGVSNTILIGAFERIKEIGMMAAMGMKRRQILLLFVLEGGMLGMFGSLTGCLLGVLAVFPLVKYGINWGFMMRDLGVFGYRIAGVSKGAWRPEMFLYAFVFGIIISSLVSFYPALIASRMEPTEALRK